MPVIHLTTIINAPAQRVFNLSRSIDLHKESMAHTNECAIAGKTNGLIEQGEWVTWEARHLLKKRYLTVAITHMQLYSLFIDEMQKGDFKMMRHEHYFDQKAEETIMTDVFNFKSPYGVIGNIVDTFFLKYYMKQLLVKRNATIKEYAETEGWKSVLPTPLDT
ncbi:SRPBCC family protein [Ilyomonas limi]|uniref:SRPBCC family protein n=1 Tax=Ilyomonas limi TaxID=2575867 RepID=A0A4V5UU92_9BACT|nr:SRPBCC family protein [Ilyomonas limi]TKK66583.1 SRPBCC family protein [Ilyomonas limi]